MSAEHQLPLGDQESTAWTFTGSTRQGGNVMVISVHGPSPDAERLIVSRWDLVRMLAWIDSMEGEPHVFD